MKEENTFEPENRTICPYTGAGHSWIYDEEAGEYRCDECGCTEDDQEDQQINNDYMKNCKCKRPKSDNYFRIGKYEGKYTKCLNCGKRIFK